MATSTNQMGGAQEAGRPQPQTTTEAGGGPFIRHSQPGYAPQYQVSGTAFGGVVTQPLVARPGYFRAFRVRHDVVSGAGTAAPQTTGSGPDAPGSINSLIQLKDAFGTPLIVTPGWEGSQLIPAISGGFGSALTGTLAPVSLPSSSGSAGLPNTASASNPLSLTGGNGTYSYSLPLEFTKGYGCLSGANASLLPTLQFNFNTLAAIYSTVPSTAPTINTTVDASFYWLPEGTAVEPPGLGTTRQWVLQQANPSVSTGGTARIQVPRLGGYLDTLAFIARDSTGTRTNTVWPTGRLQMYVDGVPLIDATVAEWFDDMAISYGFTQAQLGYAGAVSGASYSATITGPTYAQTAAYAGVLAVSRKTSLMQSSLGLLDTGEVFLSTNPGTLTELNLSPAGTIANSPATINVLAGQIVPSGAIIQGLPEV